MGILSKQIRSLFKEANKNAENATKHFDEDTIHKMRIAFKKIQALFNLLLFFSDEHKQLAIEELERSKRTFRKAGAMRELQLVILKIESDMGKKDNAKKIVLEYLKKKEKKAEKKFHDHFRNKGRKEMEELKEIMLDVSKHLRGVTLLPYFESLSKQIFDIQNKQDRSEKELHQLRKLMKELKYNLGLLSEEDGKKFELLFPSGKFDKLEQQIGEWHDDLIFHSRIVNAKDKLIRESSDQNQQNELQSFFSELEKRSDQKLQTDLRKTEKLLRK